METIGGPRERWLEAHPYLEQMARFVAAIEDAAAASRPTQAPIPSWATYAAAYAGGVPLVRSAAWTPELAAAMGEALFATVERVAAARLPQKLGAECTAVRDRLRRAPDERRAAARWLATGSPEEGAPLNAGLVRFLGWTAFRYAFAPLLEAFERWRDEGGWGRRVCPACGAAPALAQLVAAEEGSRRLLSCGCCRTRWHYRRVGCPYCGNEAPDRLGILELEGEPRLRIDFCEACQGYLKTYTGEGEEDVFLADWPTLHLDVLARERGFKRMGASLYESP